MNLQSDDFELLGITQQFQQVPADLTARWKTLQAQVHPDRFASASAAEKRLAMQWSVRVNEAYQRLKNPLTRAIYLCELHGHTIGAEDNTTMPRQFLMQQMEWLEALDDAQTQADVAAIGEQVESELEATIHATAQAIDHNRQFSAAVEHIRSWMFLSRFMQRVQARQRQLPASAA
ncbi:Fe-S protein assembly co-chaperone HscB [Lampropedia puyangensis]|uniref:Co-chaperone protein HscB homolog n=1 Tax=Lampropedia puyangensis TaxID=1330072 RepID=A0A4S8FAY4_9BURK|nr:Fe-S protein assembly co-chaperone HscB [Lampropedia puyangensis]THU04141.1 Fe-S protein assembly co-chaperone HscB [Lampropedia puyangensis]